MNGTPTRIVLLVCAALLAACGQLATPVWEAVEVTEDAHSSEIAVLPTATQQPTEIPPTATEVPPTATEVPPTATPEPTEVPPTATVEPTQAPTDIPAAAVTGDAEAGQALFVTGDVAQGALACSTCHNVNTPDLLIGPSLQGIASRAGGIVPGEDAVTYLHTSIVDPNAHVVEGFVAGLMPQVYGTAYSEDQINNLIAYLMTLE